MDFSGKTTVFKDILSNCDNIEDFKKDVFQKLDSQKNLWKKKINEIIVENVEIDCLKNTNTALSVERRM